MGRDKGLTEEKLKGLADYENAAIYSAAELAALRYADATTRTPVEVSNESFRDLQAHFDDAEIIELTSAIAWENYRARFDHALAVESEGFSEGAYCPLPV